MVKKPGKDGTEDKGLNAEDKNLWAFVLRDVLPLPGRRKPAVEDGVAPGSPPAAAPNPPVPETLASGADLEPGSGLDRRTAQRLRRGQIPVEGVLDLHGLRQAEAQARLTGFLTGAHQSGKRCVLVITGKGGRGNMRGRDDGLPGWMASEPGVLRRSLPLWLGMEPLRSIVLDTAPARPRDGGSGAVYILLRRRRGG